MAFAGLEEGSIVVWDLREQTQLHLPCADPVQVREHGLEDSETQTAVPSAKVSASSSSVLRTPTFATDCLLHDNHESPIQSLG